MGGHSQ